MAFKIAARTILHLGAELISSDAIAFYELIKNAFDAGSKRVRIAVIVRLSHEGSLLSRGAIAAARDGLAERERIKEPKPTKAELAKRTDELRRRSFPGSPTTPRI